MDKSDVVVLAIYILIFATIISVVFYVRDLVGSGWITEAGRTIEITFRKAVAIIYELILAIHKLIVILVGSEQIADSLILVLGLSAIFAIILDLAHKRNRNSSRDKYGNSDYSGSSYGSSSSTRTEKEFPLFEARTIDRGVLKDKFGGRCGTLEKVNSSGDQIVKDDFGRIRGTIEQNAWNKDVQIIKGEYGNEMGKIDTRRGERIMTDSNGHKATIQKNWKGETVIEKEAGFGEDHKNEEWYKAGYSSNADEQAQEDEEDEEDEEYEEEERRREEKEE